MKLLRILVLGIVMSLIFSACNPRKVENISTAPKDNNELSIVTSFYPIYLFTLNITKGIEGIKVSNMTPPQTGCLHDYQLTPADMKTLESADIFVANGAGLESFMDKAYSEVQGIEIIEASKGLELLEQNDGNINPHVWVSISGAIELVKNIGTRLAILDPENADSYKENMEEYVDKLKNQKSRMHKELDGFKNKKIVTFHEAFPYFASEFGLDIAAVIEREPGTEPSSRELVETIEIIRKTGVKALFAEPQYSSKAAQTIARETGAKLYMLDPVVTGSNDKNPDDYIKRMESNLKVLKEALK